MNTRAQRRANEIEEQRRKLNELLDNPHLTGAERNEIAKLLNALLTEGEKLEDGDHWLRGTTTQENKDLYEIVQRELGRVR